MILRLNTNLEQTKQFAEMHCNRNARFILWYLTAAAYIYIVIVMKPNLYLVVVVVAVVDIHNPHCKTASHVEAWANHKTTIHNPRKTTIFVVSILIDVGT